MADSGSWQRLPKSKLAVLAGITVPSGFEPTVRTEFRLPQPSKPNVVVTFDAGMSGSTTCCVIRHPTGSVT